SISGLVSVQGGAGFVPRGQVCRQSGPKCPSSGSIMAPNVSRIVHAVLEDYALPWGGDHGIAHWARVLGNGLRLAGETGANAEVGRLLAVLHDCRRINEHTDPEHGPRAAGFARTPRGRLFDLPDHEFGLLH